MFVPSSQFQTWRWVCWTKRTNQSPQRIDTLLGRCTSGSTSTHRLRLRSKNRAKQCLTYGFWSNSYSIAAFRHTLNSTYSPEIIKRGWMWERKHPPQLLSSFSGVVPASSNSREYPMSPCESRKIYRDFPTRRKNKIIFISQVEKEVSYTWKTKMMKKIRELLTIRANATVLMFRKQKDVILHALHPAWCSTPRRHASPERTSCCGERVLSGQSAAVFLKGRIPEKVWTQLSEHFSQFMSENDLSYREKQQILKSVSQQMFGDFTWKITKAVNPNCREST